MNPPKYVQIDASIYADNRVALLMRKHGAIGMAVYVYCLVEIGRQSNYPDMQISVDDIFIEAGAITNGIEYESFKAVTDDLFRIGLLQKTKDGAYSNGFNKRTGKDLLANYKRSISQAGVPKPKTDLKEPNLEPKNPQNDHKCVKTDLKDANLGESDPKKEPKKAKGESNIDAIVAHWNAEAKSMKCMKVTPDIVKAVAKVEKAYSFVEIQSTISNYHAVVKDDGCFFSYKWNLGEFLSRQNGFPVFYGDRDEIMAKYRKSGGKTVNPDQPKTRKELLDAYK